MQQKIKEQKIFRELSQSNLILKDFKKEIKKLDHFIIFKISQEENEAKNSRFKLESKTSSSK